MTGDYHLIGRTISSERKNRCMKSIDEVNSFSSSNFRNSGLMEDGVTKNVMKANYESELQKLKKDKEKQKFSFTRKLLGLMGCCTDR